MTSPNVECFNNACDLNYQVVGMTNYLPDAANDSLNLTQIMTGAVESQDGVSANDANYNSKPQVPGM